MTQQEILTYIDQKVKEEVEKFVIQKCSTELKDGEVLLVTAEVGDMPAENMAHYMKRLQTKFEEFGITKAMFAAKRGELGTIKIEKVSEETHD